MRPVLTSRVLTAVCRRKAINGEERGSRDSPAFRRHLLPVRLLLLRRHRRFKLLASSFAVCRPAQPQSLACGTLVVVCCMCLCVCVGAVRCCRCRALFPTYVSIACGHFCLLWHDRVCCRSRLVVLAFGCSFASGCFALPVAVSVESICCLSCTHILYVINMLCIYDILLCVPSRVHSIHVIMCMLQTSARVKHIRRVRKCITPENEMK